MKRRSKRFTTYQQSLFNKYEIDESYLQTNKQRRACLELLENIDKHQVVDEKSMIGKIASAFRDSELYKKIASCVTIASLLVTLQSTPAMAQASSDFRASTAITTMVEQPGLNTVVLDGDSFLNADRPRMQQEVKATSLHMVASNPMKNAYEPLGEQGVLFDEGSDVTYYPNQETRTLTVIDTFLEDWETIRDAVKEGEVLLLEGDSDPLDRILAKLEDMKEVDCLNILSHGTSGRLEFSNGTIDTGILESNKDKWQKLSGYLSKDGDIQLFGCNIAKGDQGKAFIEKLAQLTGADVAASINPTGAENKGGDWTLEAVVGDVAGSLPFTKEAIGKFMQLLLPSGDQGYNLKDFSGTGNTISNNYFLVSGSVGGSQKNVDINPYYGAYINETSSPSTFEIRVEATGDLGTFELYKLHFQNWDYSAFLPITIQIIGKHTGETFTSEYYTINFSAGLEIKNIANVSGEDLDYFIISGNTNSNPKGLIFDVFVVRDMQSANSAPTINQNTGLTLNKGSDATTISNTMLKVTDSKQGAQDLIYTIGTAPTKGTLKKETTTLTAASTFSQADIDNGKITYTPTLNQTGADSFTFTVIDGAGGNISSTTFNISINDAPTITSGATVNFAENGTGTVYDADGSDPEGGTITWSISGTDSAFFTINSTTGVVTFNTSPNFESPVDDGANNEYNFTITATDGGGLTATQNVTVIVTDVNDVPVITSGTTANAAENATTTGYTATASDEEDDAITWSINGGADAAKFSIDPVTGVLSFNDAPNFEMPSDSDTNNTYEVIIQAFDGTPSATKTVTVTVTNVNEVPSISSGSTASFTENGTGTVYDANGSDPDSGDTLTWSISGADAALFDINSTTGVVTFKNAPNYELPVDDDTNNEYNFTITATDNGSLTATKDVAITVTNVNDAPVITSGMTANAAENATASGYTTAALDEEDDAITWSINGGTDAARFSIDPATGALTFNSAPDYDAPSDSDTNNTYIVILRASDGALASDKTVTVTVTNVNEAPSISSGATANFTENGTGTVYDANGSDPDSGDALTWSISGADAALFDISSTTGVVTFKNAPNYELPVDDDTNNEYNFTITATDNGSLTATKDVAITVTNVNDAPVITSGMTANAAENATASGYTTAASDEEDDAITWSINGGTDAAKFSIDPVTGVLSFSSAPNYESPSDSDANNTYVVNIQASDGSLSSSKTVTVTVTNVNEAPSISTGTTTSFAENSTATVYDADGTDPDTSDTLTWSIGGADSALFDISSTTGVVTFKNAPNFELALDDGADNVYNFTLTATDGGGLTATQNVTVTVTDVNEAPVISSAASINVLEGSAATGYTAVGTDDENDPITWSINGGTDAAKFSIDPDTGVLTFNSAPDYESPSDSDANNTYVVNIQASDGLIASTKTVTVTVTNVNEAPSISTGTTATFPENGTGTVYDADGTDPDTDALTWSIGGADAALFNIESTTGVVTFKNAPNFELPLDNDTNNEYNFTITATDGGSLTATQNVTVTITDVNEAPMIISTTSINVLEGSAATGYTAEGTDDEHNPITWSINGGTDAAKFTINSSTGVLTFSSTPDFEMPSDSDTNNTYEVTIQVSDGSLTSSKTVTVTVTNVNEAPSVSTGTTATLAENSTGTVYDADGTDPDTDALTWSIGGADAALFDINSTTGVVTFKAAPNFESPADDGANNVYDLTITATDGGGLTATQNVTVTVTDVNEAPVISSAASINVLEGSAATGYTAAGTDDEHNPITWSINGGTDAAKFTINSSTGVLTFNNTPDFELPSDSDTNNTYEVTIQAFDGSLTSSKTVTVTVTNVNEAPSISTGTTAAFAENGTATVYDADGTDPDTSDTLIWSIGGTDAALFNINSTTGVVTFKNAPNFESPLDDGANNEYNFTITATDGGGLTATQNVTVTVTNVNEAPVISSASAVNFTESGNGTAYTASATDPEGDAITWSLGGVDADKFALSTAGLVTFKNPPVRSLPADHDANNVYDITLEALDSASLSTTINVAITVTSASNNSGGSNNSSPSTPASSGTVILVDGQQQTAGTAETTTVNNQTVTTVKVDSQKLEKVLEERGVSPTVSIPVQTGADVVVGQLNGQTIKKMEAQEAVLEIKTDNVTYTLPASQINIDSVSELIGSQVELKDITVSVTVSEPSNDTVKVIEDTADRNNYQLVVEPVQFEITCSNAGKTVEVSKFNAYVERMVAIPEGIDPDKITTGIVLNADGSFSHVPTQIIIVNGKYYAKINSLTNSTYSVIWNPKTFKDVETHWAKDAVNDMGSRLVISGIGDDIFEPNRYITRGELANILVKALGLMRPGTGKDSFKDVNKNDWYYDAVSIAYENGLIFGYNGSFRPEDQVTREEVMAMVTRAMKLTGLKTELLDEETKRILSSFIDSAESSDWAEESVAACVATGIIEGNNSRYLVPKNKITRGEVAVIIERLLIKSKLI